MYLGQERHRGSGDGVLRSRPSGFHKDGQHVTLGISSRLGFVEVL